jgi:hypothetical protein
MVRAGPLEPVLRGLLVKDPARRSGVAEARRGLQAVLDGAQPTPPARPAAAEVPSAVPSSPPAPPASPPPAPPAGESRESARRRPAAAVRGDAVARFSAEDLRALAAASRAVLGSVVSDARDHLAERQRDRREVRGGGGKAAPAPSAPPRRRRRFKRRWVFVPLLLLFLLVVAVVAAVVVVLGHVVGSF